MTQESRQVLIELLFLSLYLDDHLSLAEDTVLNDALNALGWDSSVPREQFVFKAFTAAREAARQVEKTREFLDRRAAVIRRDGAEAAALTWLTKALGADGITPSEKYFLSQLESRLYPQNA